MHVHNRIYDYNIKLCKVSKRKKCQGMINNCGDDCYNNNRVEPVHALPTIVGDEPTVDMEEPSLNQNTEDNYSEKQEETKSSIICDCLSKNPTCSHTN